MSQLMISNNESVEIKDGKIRKVFQGYTMEELRYQKSLAALRKEFCKANLQQSIVNLRKPFGSDKEKSGLLDRVADKVPVLKSTGSVARIIGKSIISRLNPMDYVMLGVSLIGPSRKIIKRFRKKKK